MEIGQIISKRRKELLMTQQQLADQLFVTVQAVSKWETGAGNPDIHLIPQISKILNIEISQLFDIDHPQEDVLVEKLQDTDVSAKKYISYRKYVIIIGFFLMVSFMFFGMLYADKLDHHAFMYNWIIYGSFLLCGFACFGVIYLLTSPSSKIAQVEPMIRIKERRNTRILATFPFLIVFGEYLFFLTMFDDFYSPVIATDFFSFFVFSCSLAFYLLPATLPFFLISVQKINQQFAFPITIVSLFIFCQMVNLEVFQSGTVFIGTILTFIWGIHLISRMVLQLVLHIDQRRIWFLPVEILSIAISSLLVVGLFAGMFLNIYARNDSDLTYVLSAYTLFSVFYIALYIVSVFFFSLDSLFGKFFKPSIHSANRPRLISSWYAKNRSILSFGFFLLFTTIYIILKLQLDMTGFERIIWIGLAAFIVAILYDAWLGPVIE